MLRSPEMKRIMRHIRNFTMVGHHYVLPIAKEFRGEIQGSVHRTSASNETVFIEPQAIAEHSAQLSFLRAREAKEVRRILRWLSAQVGQVAESLLGSLENLAELDLIFARGRYSLDYQMTAPDFNDEGRLALRGARHPLLRGTLPRADPANPRTVTPIDLHLGLQFQTLVITGPNTGGKDGQRLKTVGLLAIMAHVRACTFPPPSRVAVSRLRRDPGGHRRRAEPGAVPLDLLLARPTDLGDRRPGNRAFAGPAR